MAAKKAQMDEKRSAWNKGIEVGQRAAFTAQEVKRIKTTLAKRSLNYDSRMLGDRRPTLKPYALSRVTAVSGIAILF